MPSTRSSAKPSPSFASSRTSGKSSRCEIAVAATVEGFTEVVKALPRALTHQRGERVVEGAFFARAREEGNELGYDTIAAVRQQRHSAALDPQHRHGQRR